MSDEKTCPRARDVDRHDIELREIRADLRDNYVRKDVFDARVTPIEQRGNNTWLSNRNAILAFAGTVIGIAVSAYLAARGGH